MARRKNAPTSKGAVVALEMEKLHRAARAHFHRLANNDGINLAQYEAQLVERDMVRVLTSMALDVTGQTSPALRRQCALDVLTVARGVPKLWVHDGQTIDPDAQVAGVEKGTTIGQMIEAAKMSAYLNQELDRLAREKVPPDQWPAAIRDMVGDNIVLYAET